MGKILACVPNHKNGTEKNYVAGIVNYVREGLEGRVMNFGINVTVFDESLQMPVKWYLNLSCWNSEDPTKSQMADTFREYGIEEGDFICAQTGMIEDDGFAEDGTPRYKASAWKIIRCGKFGLSAPKQDDERTIVIGTISETESNGDYFSVTIPVDIKRYGNVSTVDYRITFSNTDNASMADEAREKLSEGLQCALLCSRIYRENDEIKLWGFKIVCGPNPAEASASTEASAAAEVSVA